jgi:lipoprotein-anchoring transpeptidase ErfK/SrfK
MPQRSLYIEVSSQLLSCLEDGAIIKSYPVSTALAGTGEARDSGCTPRGKHKIRLKIGEGCPINSVFTGRRPTGEIYDEKLAELAPERDWILTRIIWLGGLEPGINRGGKVDTLSRYIYIHGTADEHLIGQPVSHGCIRMRNLDMLELFDWVSNGMLVEIVD